LGWGRERERRPTSWPSFSYTILDAFTIPSSRWRSARLVRCILWPEYHEIQSLCTSILMILKVFGLVSIAPACKIIDISTFQTRPIKITIS
jgi:hypothetical protein